MTRKALTTKWKVIISCLLIVVAMAGSGAMAWAIAKHYFKQDYNYEITAIGNRHVNANIKSYSYLAGSSDPYETLATKTFNGTTTETTALSFTKPLIIENDEKVSKFRFEIENTSPYSTTTDLIIKVDAETPDEDDIILTWYYSTNNKTYHIYTGEYLVGHKGATTILELRVLATADLEGTANISDKVSIELFSELEPPTDFEYEYSYDVEYNENSTNAEPLDVYKTKRCPTCGNALSTRELMTDGYEFLESSTYYTNYISDTVLIFHHYNFNGTIVNFAGGLSNVTFVNHANVSVDNITFEISGDAANHSTYQDVLIQDMENISINIIYGSYDGQSPLTDYPVSNLTISNCSLYSDGGFINSAVNIENLVIDNCSVGPGFSINNVHNAVIKNSVVDYQNAISMSNVSGNIYFYSNSMSWLNMSNVHYANIKVINNHFETYDITYDTNWILLQAVTRSSISFVSNSTTSQFFKTYKVNTNNTISTLTLPLV